MNEEITTGCQANWKNDPDFKQQYREQLALFRRLFGYGPFFVKNVYTLGGQRFATINTEDGIRNINVFYLRLVKTSTEPIPQS